MSYEFNSSSRRDGDQETLICFHLRYGRRCRCRVTLGTVVEGIFMQSYCAVDLVCDFDEDESIYPCS